MRPRPRMLVALGALMAALAPAPALGHGGGGYGRMTPGSEPPPDSREPSDAVAPPAPDAGAKHGPGERKAPKCLEWTRCWSGNQAVVFELRAARRRVAVTSPALPGRAAP